MTKTEPVSGSFRDPSGFLFVGDGVLRRQVNLSYRDDYDRLMESGLYEALTGDGLLIPHREEPSSAAATEGAYKVLRPEPVAFISYPYEWSFSQLKDAALTTLRVQQRALAHGMILKDASAFNIQFHRGKPTFIDTLSFEAYREGEPWIAYRQFCQHFLAPLALLSFTDHRLAGLFRIFLDGVPLDLASRLLPRRTLLRPSLLTHLHLHGKAQARLAERAAVSRREPRVSRRGLDGLLASLEGSVRRLTWSPTRTTWSDYYSDTNYSDEAWHDKQHQVERLVGEERLGLVWDLGANTGEFSRIAAKRADLTLALDMDPAAVEKNYLRETSADEGSMLPLVVDLANPSPGIGWAGGERNTLLDRGRPDLAIALALIHHLAIGNNVPLDRIADYLRSVAPRLVIEFVPKGDSQVQRMLSRRADVFSDYSRAGFESAFRRHFEIRESVQLRDSERWLYRMDARPVA